MQVQGKLRVEGQAIEGASAAASGGALRGKGGGGVSGEDLRGKMCKWRVQMKLQFGGEWGAEVQAGPQVEV